VKLMKNGDRKCVQQNNNHMVQNGFRGKMVNFSYWHFILCNGNLALWIWQTQPFLPASLLVKTKVKSKNNVIKNFCNYFFLPES
jgi:hypothetical protein